MFKTAKVQIASAVATNGTFTLPYPDGTNAGSFAGAWGHKMWSSGHQKMYSAPNDFTVSFASTSIITVTYLGTTSLPAGSYVNLQLDVFGADDADPNRAVIKRENERRVGVHVLDLGSPITADADGIAASQTVTGAGTAFVLNGALVVGGVAVFDVPRNVVGAWTNAAVLTITGTDVDGNAVVEKSASGTSHTGKKAFKTVTSVTTSATVTGATVGSGVVLGLPRFVPDASYIQLELMNGVALPRPPGKVIIPWEIEATELSAGTAENIVSPVAGYIDRVRGVVQEAIVTGGAVTFEINTVAVTGLTITAANSDAAGTRYSDRPTTRHASDSLVAAGDRITVTPAAAFNGGGALNGTIEIDTTAAGQLEGTFVAGVTSAATATTGDTRGTYSPSITPDGTNGYVLIAVMPDPANQGVPQYVG